MKTITAEEVIKIFGGVSNVARFVGVKSPSVCGWREKNIVPDDKLIIMAPTIEAMTVNTDTPFTRKSMFPNNWQIIWPELLTENTEDKAVNQ